MKPFKTPAAFLAPIRASHLVQLDVYTDTRNFIHIWLPENYGKPPHDCCTFDRTEDRRFRMEGDTLVTTLIREGSFEIRGEVAPIEDGVGLTLSVTNLSSEALPGSVAGVCIQFAAAASFVDTELKRYFYVHDDRITAIHPPYEDYDKGHAWFWGTAPREEFQHNPSPDFGFVGLESADGKWVVGHGWDSARTICGNCHPSISCIHADPFFDALPPGEAVSSHGVLYIMEGTATTCLERFRREFLSA
tara:strand:+ start:1632 stop:2372 length:741 start_codon:yes stop_codon:yes gene_type:complete